MKYSELLRMLERSGWMRERQTGSHIILRHRDYQRQIVFPDHGAKEMKKGIEQTIKKQARLK